MNVFILAMTLGPHPLSAVPDGLSLVEELKTMFPEGNVCHTTTGDELRFVFTELSEKRQRELLSLAIEVVDLTELAEAVRLAYIAGHAEERRFGYFLLVLAVAGLMAAAAMLVYIVEITQPLIQAAAVVDQRQRDAPKADRLDLKID